MPFTQCDKKNPHKSIVELSTRVIQCNYKIDKLISNNCTQEKLYMYFIPETRLVVIFG